MSDQLGRWIDGLAARKTGYLLLLAGCHYSAGTWLFGATLQPGTLALLLGWPAGDWAANAATVLPVAALEEALRHASTLRNG